MVDSPENDKQKINSVRTTAIMTHISLVIPLTETVIYSQQRRLFPAIETSFSYLITFTISYLRITQVMIGRSLLKSVKNIEIMCLHEPNTLVSLTSNTSDTSPLLLHTPLPCPPPCSLSKRKKKEKRDQYLRFIFFFKQNKLDMQVESKEPKRKSIHSKSISLSVCDHWISSKCQRVMIKPGAFF